MSDANAVSVIHICSAQDVKEPESRRKHMRPKNLKKCFQASHSIGQFQPKPADKQTIFLSDPEGFHRETASRNLCAPSQ